MPDEHSAVMLARIERTLELARELEASGQAQTTPEAVAMARQQLHEWVDAITGVVITPALGKVTVIHANGRESTIVSAELPYAMSKPVGAR